MNTFAIFETNSEVSDFTIEPDSEYEKIEREDLLNRMVVNQLKKRCTPFFKKYSKSTIAAKLYSLKSYLELDSMFCFDIGGDPFTITTFEGEDGMFAINLYIQCVLVHCEQFDSAEEHSLWVSILLNRLQDCAACDACSMMSSCLFGSLCEKCIEYKKGEVSKCGICLSNMNRGRVLTCEQCKNSTHIKCGIRTVTPEYDYWLYKCPYCRFNTKLDDE